MLATPAVAALLLLLACIGGSQQSPINGIKLKIDRINSNTQVTVSVMRCKCEKCERRRRLYCPRRVIIVPQSVAIKLRPRLP